MIQTKLVKNVVTKRWTFKICYRDGRVEDRTVEAESKDAAFLLLQSELWDEENKITEVQYDGKSS